MNPLPTSYSAGRVVPGVLELEATLPLEGIRAAGRLWESAGKLCAEHCIDTSGPTSSWLTKLVAAVPEFQIAMSWVEAGLHEGFHFYQLLSTNYGRVRLATEHEILSIKAHAYDSMLRSGFRFATEQDGGVNLCEMLLASPNSQFEMMGDMLSTFEEMRDYAEGFTDERLQAMGFVGESAITANALEEEAASFFALFSTQGGDAVRTVGKTQRDASPKYSTARICFERAGGTDALVLFAMIHLSFRYGSYTPEEGDHPVAIFASLIERMPEITELSGELLAQHADDEDAFPSKSLSAILGTDTPRAKPMPGEELMTGWEQEGATLEMKRQPLTSEQRAVLDLFAKLCEGIVELIECHCSSLDKGARDDDDLLPKKPFFEGVWEDFNRVFPAWTLDWEIALSLISPVGTTESGFMFWSSIRKVVNFGSDRLDIGGVQQAYLAIDRLERLFQGKAVRLSLEQMPTRGMHGFEAHANTPGTVVGSINALLAEYRRDLWDVAFDPTSPDAASFREFHGGFYAPQSLFG